MTPRLSICALLGLLFPLFCAAPEQVHAFEEVEFSFALIGDMPYQTGLPTESQALAKLRTQINQDKSLAWIIHAGDIKTGGQACSDTFLKSRKAYFDTFVPALIYTPGDNEWTDCHRPAAGSFDPLERLIKLRENFYQNDNKKMNAATDAFMSQADYADKFSAYRENALWQKQGVTFATIHIVGSANGLLPFAPKSAVKRAKRHDHEVKQREAAALYWLKTSFEQARKNASAAIFITIHANPGLFNGAKKSDKAPYTFFLQKLETLTKTFSGQVVLAHGDSHIFRVDQPALIANSPPRNFLRVETFGHNDANWIKVTVKSKAPSVFSFTPVLN